MQFNIYEYQSSQQILVEYLSARQGIDEKFSLRKWAAEMELKTHTILQMWIRGQRPIRPKHVPTLSVGMSLSASQKVYFENIVLLDNAKSGQEKTQLLERLNFTPGYKNEDIRILDEFQIVSRWYYMAILAMGDFTRQDLVDRLGHRLKVPEIDAAIIRLEKMELVAKRGESYKTTVKTLVTHNDVADSGAKAYYKETADLAIDSLHNDPLEEREFQSFALSIDPKKMALAKKMIREFRREFCLKVGKRPRNKKVYQMNVHFFPLSRSEGTK